MKKIGIFGGSFNPIHNSHLKMAAYIQHYLNLDTIIFIPTYNAKHKSQKDQLNFFTRKRMIELGISKKKCFSVSILDYTLNMNSYTFYTLKALRNIYSDNEELYFIIGEDSYQNFHLWYRFEELQTFAKFVVFSRDSETIRLNSRLSSTNFIFLKYQAGSDSSTQIRDRIKNSINIDKAVPNAVRNFIDEFKLYQ